MSEDIKFYKIADPYGQFSNFAKFPINLDGKVWPTTEHYYQAQKFTDPDIQERVRLCETPKMSANMGRDRSLPLRPDWEVIKDEIMFKACWAKFTQYNELKQLLLGTGDAYIVEHSKNDSYWADGGDGTGLNRLGFVLMKVRSELRLLNSFDMT